MISAIMILTIDINIYNPYNTKPRASTEYFLQTKDIYDIKYSK